MKRSMHPLDARLQDNTVTLGSVLTPILSAKLDDMTVRDAPDDEWSAGYHEGYMDAVEELRAWMRGEEADRDAP